MSNIINELELSVRTSNTLKRLGDVDTMEDFMALTEGRVRAVRGAGRRTWNEIRDVQTHFRQIEKRRAESARATPSVASWSERDLVAMHVLPKIMDACAQDTREPGETHEQMFARKAYALADAMLAARKTKVEDLLP